MNTAIPRLPANSRSQLPRINLDPANARINVIKRILNSFISMINGFKILLTKLLQNLKQFCNLHENRYLMRTTLFPKDFSRSLDLS